MSAKLRLTVWIAAMMLILCAIMLFFIIWVDRTGLVNDSPERLVETVSHNEKKFEAEHSDIAWDDVDFYIRGVYCAFYDEKGKLLRGVTVDGLNPSDIPFDEYVVQSIPLDGDEFFVYDAQLVTRDGQPIWIRGIAPGTDDYGAAHTVIIMTAMLLPVILIISIIGGWIISKQAFAPVVKITQTANSISDGNDLTERIALHSGPSELIALSNTFDGMFDRLERSFSAEKQFTSDASHELRTPITVIRASCDRAKRKDVTREDFLRTLDVIDEQADNMSLLVNHLLSLHGSSRVRSAIPCRGRRVGACVRGMRGLYARGQARHKPAHGYRGRNMRALQCAAVCKPCAEPFAERIPLRQRGRQHMAYASARRRQDETHRARRRHRHCSR